MDAVNRNFPFESPQGASWIPNVAVGIYVWPFRSANRCCRGRHSLRGSLAKCLQIAFSCRSATGAGTRKGAVLPTKLVPKVGLKPTRELPPTVFEWVGVRPLGSRRVTLDPVLLTKSTASVPSGHVLSQELPPSMSAKLETKHSDELERNRQDGTVTVPRNSCGGWPKSYAVPWKPCVRRSPRSSTASR